MLLIQSHRVLPSILRADKEPARMPLYLRVGVADKSKDAPRVESDPVGFRAGVKHQTVFDERVDEPEQQTSTAVELLLVEATHEGLIDEGHSHEAVELVLVLSQGEASLILHHKLIVVEGRRDQETPLLHKVQLVELIFK